MSRRKWTCLGTTKSVAGDITIIDEFVIDVGNVFDTGY